MLKRSCRKGCVRLFLLLSLVALSLNSCLLVPFVESFNRTGITRQQRVAQLTPTVNNFQSNLFWGEREKALTFALPTKEERLRAVIRSLPEDERIVDAKVIETLFSKEAYEASVVVKIRSYMPANLIISERKHKQTWKFALGNGWRIVDLKELSS
jgi:hypothetical protein